MGHEYEMADYNRNDLIFTKEMLLAEPIERTPLRREGEMSGSFVVRRSGLRLWLRSASSPARSAPWAGRSP